MFQHNGDRVKRAKDFLALVALAPPDAGPARNKALAWAELLTV